MAFPGATNDPQGADAHLQRLLAADVEEPWFFSFIKNIRETLNPPKLPPLEVTSTPVPVKDIWGSYGGQEKRAGLSSLLIHAVIISLLLFVGTNKAVQKIVKDNIALIAPDLSPYKPMPKKDPMGGGGGGGDRSPTPPSKGKLPRLADKEFVPPMAVVHNENPILVMEPTLIIQPDANIPKIGMDRFRDALAKSGIASNGPGSAGGIGSGPACGVGSGPVPAYVPGACRHM